MKKARKLSEGSNGDRWYLVRDPRGAVMFTLQSQFRRVPAFGG